MDIKEMTYCQLPASAKHQESAADYLTILSLILLLLLLGLQFHHGNLVLQLWEPKAPKWLGDDVWESLVGLDDLEDDLSSNDTITNTVMLICFVLSWRMGFLARAMATWLSTIDVGGRASSLMSSLSSRHSRTPWHATVATTMYSLRTKL
jgi:hypothetical protein